MINNNNFVKRQQQLCELKLEERRVRTDISRLVRQNRTIDFYQAQKLNSERSGLKSQIKKVEACMMPNIIA